MNKHTAFPDLDFWDKPGRHLPVLTHIKKLYLFYTTKLSLESDHFKQLLLICSLYTQLALMIK